MIWIPIVVVGMLFLIFYSYILTAIVYTSGFIGTIVLIFGQLRLKGFLGKLELVKFAVLYYA